MLFSRVGVSGFGFASWQSSSSSLLLLLLAVVAVADVAVVGAAGVEINQE